MMEFDEIEANIIILKDMLKDLKRWRHNKMILIPAMIEGMLQTMELIYEEIKNA